MLGKTRAELDAALQEVIAAGEKLKAKRIADIEAQRARTATREAKAATRQANAAKYGTKGNINRKFVLKKRYGLTPEQFIKLSDSQGGLCAICKRIMNGICIDHDHETGKVRGLLCRNCNTGLGMFEENIEFLRLCITYIEKHKEL